jgi:hypothetical protein
MSDDGWRESCDGFAPRDRSEVVALEGGREVTSRVEPGGTQAAAATRRPPA